MLLDRVSTLFAFKIAIQGSGLYVNYKISDFEISGLYVNLDLALLFNDPGTEYLHLSSVICEAISVGDSERCEDPFPFSKFSVNTIDVTPKQGIFSPRHGIRPPELSRSTFNKGRRGRTQNASHYN